MASYAEVVKRGLRSPANSTIYEEAGILMKVLLNMCIRALEYHNGGQPKWGDSDRRDDYTQMFSWVVITPDLINAICQFISRFDGPVIEVLAGKGWLSYFLNAELIKRGSLNLVQPSDLSPDERKICPLKVNKMGAGEHIEKANPKVVIMSWPPYLKSIAIQVARQLVRQGGAKLLYIGELATGCCADDDFFLFVSFFQTDEKIELDSGEYGDEQHVTWWGIHDTIRVYHLDKPVYKFELVDLRRLGPRSLNEWIDSVLFSGTGKKNSLGVSSLTELVDLLNMYEQTISELCNLQFKQMGTDESSCVYRSIETRLDSITKVYRLLKDAIRFIELSLDIKLH